MDILSYILGKQAGGGGGNNGGYDLVIKGNTWRLDQITALETISGTFAACEAKALAQEPIRVLLYGAAINTPEFPYTKTFGIISVYYDNYAIDEEDHDILIEAMDYDANANKLIKRLIALWRGGGLTVYPPKYVSMT